MKLIKCYIENFGKLSNYKYEFKDGLNIINESNGFGKTTFASFIKAMFYGLESTAKRSVGLTDRKKYIPWQGGKFGGNIEFEIDEKRYKVERFFGAKEQEDTFMLYDMQTNLESHDYTQNLGEEIFKINKEAYERSTYIPSQKIPIKINDSLNAKLGNVLESENDINSSEEAIKKLAESIRIYKRTGNRGLLDELKDKINQLERKIENGKVEEQTLEKRREKFEETKKQIKVLNEEKINVQKMLTQKIEQDRKLAQKQVYESLVKKENDNRLTVQKLQEFFKNDIPTDEEIDILMAKSLEIEKYKIEVQNCKLNEQEQTNLQELENIFKGNELLEEEINQKIQECNKQKEIENNIETNEIRKNQIEKSMEDIIVNKTNIIILVIAIIFAIAGIAGSIIANTMQIAIAGVLIGVILAFVYFAKNNQNKKLKIKYDKKQEELEQYEELISTLKEQKEQISRGILNFINQYLPQENNLDTIIALTQIKTNLDRYNSLKLNATNIEHTRYDISKKLNLLEESIKEYMGKYFEDLDKPFANLAQELKLKKNELEKAINDEKISHAEKEEYEKNNNIEELKESAYKLENVSKEVIEDKISKLDMQISTLSDEKNYNKNQIELLETNLEEISNFENELEYTRQELKEAEEKCAILEKTKKYLEKAKEQFSSHYLKGMVTGFENYLKLLNGETLDANIDVNLDVKIEANGSKRSIDYFSTGYKDLIYICMRFSLVDALFESEKPFVILDDPFVNLDEQKIDKAVNLVKSISNKYQIVYFVCHKSRSLRLE